ncbi:MAG: hypothetical protein ACR2LI_16825 [Propionibacteriaceae bacterium]
MIPTDWTPHRRESDGELVGYLVPASGATEGYRFVPVTLFGYPLGPAGDEHDGIAVLEAEGLACLAEHWWLMPDGPSGSSEPIRVRIYETTPDQVSVLVDDFGAGGNLGTRVELPVPESGRLSRV